MPGRPGDVVAPFLKIGAVSFGGPLAAVALIQKEAARLGWVDGREFAATLGVMEAVPGPTATEMAIFVGWKRAGRLGGLLAGLCYILPGFLLVLALTAAYLSFGAVPAVDAVLWGVRPAALALIFWAGWELARETARTLRERVLLALAFVAVLAGLPPAAAVFGAGAAAAVLAAAGKGVLRAAAPVWLLGPAGADLSERLSNVAVGTLKAGALVFGGGYVIVPYLAQDFVGRWGYLDQAQFLAGMAVANATPGPVSLAATFVGMVSAGLPGAVVGTLGIFLPCFAILLLFLPVLGRLRDHPRLAAVFAGLAAGAVGTLFAAGVGMLPALAEGKALAAVLFVASLAALRRFSPAQVVLGAGAAGLLLSLVASPAAAEPAYILNGARVPGHEEPIAVAIEGRRIAAVGVPAKVARTAGPETRVFELDGAWVLPGFNDAHLHFMDGALSLFRADLSTAATAVEAAAIAGAYARARPEEPWVLGFGWSHTNYPGEAYPTAAELDAEIPDRPAVMEHVDGHLLWANSKALEAAGIGRRTADPPGGQILRGEDGAPTGVLLENAMALLTRAVPEPPKERRVEALHKALELARSLGVTSVQGRLDSQDPKGELEAWREVVQVATVTVRYAMWGDLEKPKRFLDLKETFSDLPRDRFTFWGVKGFVDGVLSARTAVLQAPYADDPAAKGEPNLPQMELNRLVYEANRLRLPVALHAVGDGGVRMALDAFETAIRREAPRLRNRIEHVEVADPRDVARFKALGVTASVQPTHMMYERKEQAYNDARLGEKRAKNAFAWRSLQGGGARLAFGTDWPVMPLDPRLGLFAATERRHLDGSPEGGWVPDQRIGLWDAVRHYTEGSAAAESAEEKKGRVEPGFLADLVVLGAGLADARGADLRALPVEATFFDGRLVFARPGGPVPLP